MFVFVLVVVLLGFSLDTSSSFCSSAERRPVFENKGIVNCCTSKFKFIIESSRNADRGFALVADLISFLEKVQLQQRAGVSLGSFIRQAISLRESWMRETCARGRPCTPPDHWPCNLLEFPPSDADFPVEIAENFGPRLRGRVVSDEVEKVNRRPDPATRHQKFLKLKVTRRCEKNPPQNRPERVSNGEA